MTYHIGLDVRLTHYQQGGISRYIEALMTHLPAAAPHNRYIWLASRKDRRDYPHKSDCWTPPHHRLERWAFGFEAATRRLDLLHSPDFIPPAFGCRRSVITIHDLTFLHYPQFLTPESRRYYNDQIDYAARRAHTIVTDSEATRVDVLERLRTPPEKVTTIHLGLSPHFAPADQQTVQRLRAEQNLPEQYLLFVGTFEPRKNVGGLLRAYRLLRESLPDAPPLVLAGRPGWLFEDTQALAAALHLEGHLLWRRNVPEELLPALYTAAALLVLPSFYEGFGFPPLEAMACGTPVVASQRASLPEIVGDAGLLVDPDQPESIAEALHRLLSDSHLCQTMRTRGFEQAKRFTWEATARKTAAIYQQTLEA